MTHKFKITYFDTNIVDGNTNPCLYKLWFAERYYIHKGKDLYSSVNRLLYDVFRKIVRPDVSISEYYEQIVWYCNKYPQINNVSIEVLGYYPPDKIIGVENALLKKAKGDNNCLNVKNAYIPEWITKEVRKKRCESGCVKFGIVKNKKSKFAFCPECGRRN